MLTETFNAVAPWIPFATGAFVALVGGLTLKRSFNDLHFDLEQNTNAILTRFGRYIGTVKEPGWHWKLPSPFQKVAKRISMALQQSTMNLEIKTNDDLFVGLPITMQWQVTDPKKYVFDNDKPLDQAVTLVEASVRSHIAGKSFQDLYSGDRAKISEEVIADVKDHVSDYGIVIRRIVIDQPKASNEVKARYENVRTSAMDAAAAKNQGQALIERETASAEAAKIRELRISEGVAGFRKNIADGYIEIRENLTGRGVDPHAADAFMLRAMELDTIRDVGQKGNMVIVVPSGGEGGNVAHQLTDLAALKKPLEKILEQGKPAADAPAAPTIN
jgi:regulator of protease activity HflC (stomatin/prohibitin superfamily)